MLHAFGTIQFILLSRQNTSLHDTIIRHRICESMYLVTREIDGLRCKSNAKAPTSRETRDPGSRCALECEKNRPPPRGIPLRLWRGTRGAILGEMSMPRQAWTGSFSSFSLRLCAFALPSSSSSSSSSLLTYLNPVSARHGAITTQAIRMSHVPREAGKTGKCVSSVITLSQK